MKTELMEAMTSGVIVEFRDPAGNTLGQTVFEDWRGRPVPAVNDMLAGDVASGRASRRLIGRVAARRFDVQTDADGSPCVWVHLVVEVLAAPRPRRERTPAAGFSRN